MIVICKFIYFLQSLSATLNGKKADVGPWIQILTSRHPEHLDQGEASLFFPLFEQLLCIHCLLFFVHCSSSVSICSANGTGAAVRSGGEWHFGEEVYRGCSTGLEGFRSVFCRCWLLVVPHCTAILDNWLFLQCGWAIHCNTLVECFFFKIFFFVFILFLFFGQHPQLHLMYNRCYINKRWLIDWLFLMSVTAECIQNPNAYLAKRLTSTKVGRRHSGCI